MTPVAGSDGATFDLPVVNSVMEAQDRVLILGQIDVANPDAYGRGRYTDTPRDLLDRKTFLAP
jgi:hypothetical protein